MVYKVSVLKRLILFFFLAAAPAGAEFVRVPIADIRSQPIEPQLGISDDKQETQVLFGEAVQVVGSSGAWSRVVVPDQMEFSHRETWEGYPGWIPTVALSSFSFVPTAVVRERWAPVAAQAQGPERFRLPLGAKVSVLRHSGNWAEIDLLDGPTGWVPIATLGPIVPRKTEERRRAAVLKTARKFLGDPYLWGGRSPATLDSLVRLSGVDCSGLVHLSLSVNGLSAPRDAHEQWMKAIRIQRKDLKPGDLIFSASAKTPTKITHVAFYTGHGRILEAPQTGLVVREITFRQKFGQDLRTVESDAKVGDRVIYFGKLIP